MLIKSSTLKKGMLYTACLLILAFSMMGHVPVLGGYLNKLTQVAVAVLIVLCFMQNRYMSQNVLIWLCIGLAYSIELMVHSGFAAMFKLILLIAASRAIDFKSLLKMDILYRIVFTATIFGLCFLGIAPNRSAAYPDGSVRYSWGFQNSNHLGLMVFIVILELLYIWDMKMTLRRTAGVMALLVFSEVFSGSRTAELAGVFIIGCALVYTINPNIWKKPLIKWVATYNVWLMAALTAFLAISFEQKKPWAVKLDKLLSARLTHIEYFDRRYNASLFGSDLSAGGRTLDTLYAYLWFSWGIVGFIVFCVAVTLLVKSAYKKNAIPFVIIMLCLTIYGISERLWMYVDYNILLIAFRELFFHDVFQETKISKLKRQEIMHPAAQ